MTDTAAATLAATTLRMVRLRSDAGFGEATSTGFNWRMLCSAVILDR